MPRKGIGEYPSDWKIVSDRLKNEVGWRCVRCKHPAERPGHRVLCDELCDASKHPGGLNDGRQRVLTVHHLTGDKRETAWYLAVPLCQVCHLTVQAKVVMERIWYLSHSLWFRPYVAGYVASTMLGVELDRETATVYADMLIAVHQGRIDIDTARSVLEEYSVAR